MLDHPVIQLIVYIGLGAFSVGAVCFTTYIGIGLLYILSGKDADGTFFNGAVVFWEEAISLAIIISALAGIGYLTNMVLSVV